MKATKAILAAALGIPLLGATALAQEYPTRAIEMIIPYSAGGSSDITGRILAEALQKELGQPVLVVNRPGASSIVGTQQVATAKPDGYTLLANTTAFTVIANKPGLPFDSVNGFIPITRYAAAPYLLVVNPEKLPVHNMQELIEALKAKPGAYNYASTGVGTSAHLAAELLSSLTGVKMAHVPYPGGAGPGVQATIAGDTHMTFASPASVMAAIEAGQLRAIAASGAERWSGMPDLPTVAEQGVEGFAVDWWSGLFAPAGTPPEIIAKISEATRKALENPDLVERFKGFDYTTPFTSPEEFGAWIKEDIERWGKVIKEANIEL
jgi:tripartite-type tricarboxylate transporter receptor subunit TctC